MKVKDLQEQLSKLNPNMEVICYTEDEDLQTIETIFRLLEIQAINVFDAEKARLNDGTPYFRLGKNPKSSKMVFLNVTMEF